jgi:hypothetical protein
MGSWRLTVGGWVRECGSRVVKVFVVWRLYRCAVRCRMINLTDEQQAVVPRDHLTFYTNLQHPSCVQTDMSKQSILPIPIPMPLPALIAKQNETKQSKTKQSRKRAIVQPLTTPLLHLCVAEINRNSTPKQPTASATLTKSRRRLRNRCSAPGEVRLLSKPQAGGTQGILMAWASEPASRKESVLSQSRRHMDPDGKMHVGAWELRMPRVGASR